MAVQFAPKEGSFGATIGEATGKAVGQGLSSLIEKKISDLNRHTEIQKRKQWIKKANLPDWLGDIEDEDIFKEFVKKFEMMPPEAQEEFRVAMGNIGTEDIDEDQPQQQNMQQQAQQPMPVEKPQQQPFFGVRPPVAPNGSESPLGTQAPAEDMGKGESKISGLNSLMEAGSGNKMEQAPSSNVQSFPQLGKGTSGAAAPQQPTEPRQQEPKTQWSMRGKGQPTSIQQQRLDLAREKEAGVKERFTFRETKKYVSNILEREKAKTEEDNVLKRIIKISEKDDARNPVLTNIMQQLGINYQGLLNDDALELSKLEKWFLRGGVKMFGGRVTNAEMGVLLSQVPSLLQTASGRKRLAEQMLLANKDFHEETRILKKIMKENGNRAPLDIELLVDEEMGPVRERNAEAFINGFDNKSSLKVGKKYNLGDLPEGAKITKDGKKYIIQNGIPVPRS